MARRGRWMVLFEIMMWPDPGRIQLSELNAQAALYYLDLSWTQIAPKAATPPGDLEVRTNLLSRKRWRCETGVVCAGRLGERLKGSRTTRRTTHTGSLPRPPSGEGVRFGSKRPEPMGVRWHRPARL